MKQFGKIIVVVLLATLLAGCTKHTRDNTMAGANTSTSTTKDDVTVDETSETVQPHTENPWAGERDRITGEYDDSVAWDYYVRYDGKIYGRHPGKFDVEVWTKNEPEMPADAEKVGNTVASKSFPMAELEASFIDGGCEVYYSEELKQIYVCSPVSKWLTLYQLEEADYVDKNVIE